MSYGSRHSPLTSVWPYACSYPLPTIKWQCVTLLSIYIMSQNSATWKLGSVGFSPQKFFECSCIVSFSDFWTIKFDRKLNTLFAIGPFSISALKTIYQSLVHKLVSGEFCLPENVWIQRLLIMSFSEFWNIKFSVQSLNNKKMSKFTLLQPLCVHVIG